MDFKLLFFLIFHYFLINSSICASLPLPKEAFPIKSRLPHRQSHLQLRHFLHVLRSPNYHRTSFSNPNSYFGSKADLDAPLCLEISTSWALGVCHLLTGKTSNMSPSSLIVDLGIEFLASFSLIIPLVLDLPLLQHLKKSRGTQKDVAKHIYIVIKLNASFKDRPIYITGDSYAGKYVPAIGYHVLKRNAKLPVHSKVNLVGVVIGNGLTDPISQVATHAAYAYCFGLINDKQKIQLESLQTESISLANNGNWSEATNARSEVLNTLQNMTGMATLYNIRRHKPYQNHLVAELMNNVEVKKALGVNETIVFKVCSKVVRDALHKNLMKSVKYMVEFLVKNTKVLLYEGQLDLRDGLMSTEAWVKRMKWEGIDKFLEADRKIWRVNGELAGYVQKWSNLSHVEVFGAGHLVPHDQPLNSQAMIEDWVLEKGLFTNDQIENLSTYLFNVL